MARIYLQIPQNDVLASKSGWQSAGDDTFFAMRAHIVGNSVRAAATLKGPPIEAINLASGVEYTAELKRIRVEKYTEEITHSIEQTITTKFTEEISQKLAAEIGVSTPLISAAKLSSEMQAKSGFELTNAVRSSLTTKRSFEVQKSEEVRRSITYKTSAETTLRFYLEYWLWRWEFYLYRAELLRLRYKSHWLWPDVRETIEERIVEPKRPLFAVVFYEPQDTQSVTDHAYTPDVIDGDEVKVEPLTATLPEIRYPSGQSLQDLARLAFPVTRAERKSARTRRKSAKRKTMVSRKAKRLAAKRKTARKASAKRSRAKKSAMRKRARKKSVARKAAPKRAGR